MNNKILIVDDEYSILRLIKDILEDEGFETAIAKSAEESMTILQKNDADDFQAALIDIWMSEVDGIQLLEWIKDSYPKLPVIMMSGHGTIETAVKATKKGAYDFIEKPLSIESILLTVRHALKESALQRENEELKRRHIPKNIDIIGFSTAIKAVLEQVSMAAPSDSWVLIQGENGTGKDLVAKQIHFQSLRKSEPFIELNCAAIPEELIESELFGYEKGSFSGAVKTKIGKFEQANRGALFLDEIGDMSLKTQSKILRILEEQRFQRVGGTATIEVDVRIIAASNKDLQKEIALGNFREDLFYRLNVIPIEVPPLSKRKEDIPLLIKHFIKQFSVDGRHSKKSITPAAIECLMSYHWPGNIRELRNIVERMMIMLKEDVIELKHVPPSIRMATEEIIQVDEFPPVFSEAKDVFEKRFIKSMLKKNNWDISKTSEAVKMKRRNLQQMIKRLDIVVPNN